MKRIQAFLTAAFLLLAPAVSGAQQAEQARDFLEEKIDSVLEVLEQQDLDDEEKKEKVQKIVDPVFNYELMSKLALGPRHWPRLSDSQKETFSERFVKRLKESYFDKITMYSGDSDAGFKYGSPEESSGKVRVPVTVRTEDGKFEMVYKFYLSDDNWLVYDVELDGVSIVKSYRSQFDELLSDGSIEDMLEELKTGDEI